MSLLCERTIHAILLSLSRRVRMSLFRRALVIGLLAVSVNIANSQAEKALPGDDEINLVLDQTERAMQQYRPLIDEEEVQMGKSDLDAVAKDRETVTSLEMAIQAFRKDPQGFNGPKGFVFFQWLDNASRNSLLCANYASARITVETVNRDTARAHSLLHLAQGCSDVSTLIYTVSENVGALYARYVRAENQALIQGARADSMLAQ